jgi:hypothetical protein
MSRPAPDLHESYRALEAWGRGRDWLGPDPYEGLNARHARLLTLGGREIPRRLLIQAVRRSPVDLRPLLGIRPEHNSKAVAQVVAGYARGGGDRAALEEQVKRLLGMATGPGEAAWGYHFDFHSRVYFYPRGVPNTIATSFATHGLLDAWEIAREDAWLDAARRAAHFLVARMLAPRSDGKAHFRYVAEHDDLIHNANALAIGAVHRTAQAAGEPVPDGAVAALECLLDAQRPDGSWLYGESPSLSWIDSYHTGYTLESLEYTRRAGAACDAALARGLVYYDEALFLADGLTPRWTVDQALPCATHCIAEAVDVHAAVADWRPESAARALALAEHGVAIAGRPDGSFVFERRRFWTNRLPLMRWANAPMFRALGSAVRILAR